MKQTSKYVKTRGQRMALENNQNQNFIEIYQNNSNKYLTTKNSMKQVGHQMNHSLTTEKTPRKHKKIAKELSQLQKDKLVKSGNKQRINQLRQKFNQSSQSQRAQNKSDLFKPKIQKKTYKNNNSALVGNKQLNRLTYNKKKILSQTIINVQIPSKKIGGNIIKSKTVRQASINAKEAANKKLGQIKTKKLSQKQVNASIIKSSEPIVKQNNIKKQDKTQVRLKQIATIPTQSLPIKKGRPRKQQISNYQLTLNEQKYLDEFVQHAIKIRKLKNQKQFYECFSRITQFAKQSWEYGDLNKRLASIPKNEDILRIGIQIVRGIRKQTQHQPQFPSINLI